MAPEIDIQIEMSTMHALILCRKQLTDAALFKNLGSFPYHSNSC